MGRFARENEFDNFVRGAVDAAGSWPISKDRAFALVKGIIGAESSFNPRAVRGEPQIGDASMGLMQLLISTARSLGFTGDPQLLYDPATNVHFGAKLLRGLLVRAGSEDGAISAYNGGYRPELGFGAKRTAVSPRVCLQWKATAPSTGRIIDRDCAVVGSTVAGTFSNQSYVDKVKSYTEYFFRNPPAVGTGQPSQPEPERGSAQINVALVGGLVAALLGLLVLRGR